MTTQDVTRPVFLPVVIGTPRQGRLTEPAANLVFGEVSKRSDIDTVSVRAKFFALPSTPIDGKERIRFSRDELSQRSLP